MLGIPRKSGPHRVIIFWGSRNRHIRGMALHVPSLASEHIQLDFAARMMVKNRISTATTCLLLLAFVLSLTLHVTCVGGHGYYLINEKFPDSYFTHRLYDYSQQVSWRRVSRRSRDPEQKCSRECGKAVIIPQIGDTGNATNTRDWHLC